MLNYNLVICRKYLYKEILKSKTKQSTMLRVVQIILYKKREEKKGDIFMTLISKLQPISNYMQISKLKIK